MRLHDTSCTGPINALTWMDGRIENTGHLILALHPPYHLILWDTSLGTKVWKKSYDTVSRSNFLISYSFFRYHELESKCNKLILNIIRYFSTLTWTLSMQIVLFCNAQIVLFSSVTFSPEVIQRRQ